MLGVGLSVDCGAMDLAPDRAADRRISVLSAPEIRTTAELARLLICDADIEQISRELSAILDYAGQLSEVDVKGVPPTTHAVAMTCPLRADVVGEHDSLAEALRNAPAKEAAFFSVPTIFPAAPDAAGGPPEAAEPGES